MSQMTPSQARLVDPILTEVARGYTSQKAMIANALFPIVQVGTRGGLIPVFGPDSFKLVSTARAPGANTKRITLDYGKDKFALVDHRLEALIPREVQEEADKAPGIDIVAMHIGSVQDRMAIEREKQAADLARDDAKYAASNKETLSGTSQWSDPASNPFADIMDAKEAIRTATGETPNVLTLAPKVLTALRTHPKVLDRMSTASDRPPATMAQLQALFELDQIVTGNAVYHDGTALQDIWGKDAILAYTVREGARQFGSPSYGYTYQLSGYPWVEKGYQENNMASWAYPVSDAYQPVLVGPSAGFLFKNAVA